MLKNQEGKIVQVTMIHTQKARESVLAGLREVHEPESIKCGTMFKLGTRARFVQ